MWPSFFFFLPSMQLAGAKSRRQSGDDRTDAYRPSMIDFSTSVVDKKGKEKKRHELWHFSAAPFWDRAASPDPAAYDLSPRKIANSMLFRKIASNKKTN